MSTLRLEALLNGEKFKGHYISIMSRCEYGFKT